MTVEPLPPRGAMHRDIPKGSRLEIANAYAVGRLIDGQAIADAWNNDALGRGFAKGAVTNFNPELADLLDALGGTDNE